MAKNYPDWYEELSEFCRGAQIKILAWGEDAVVVEAKSADRVQEISTQLAQLGFKVVENDTDAGMLTVSRNPDAGRAKIASFDVSRRRWDERWVPLIYAVAALLWSPRLLPGRHTSPGSQIFELLLLALFFREGTRIWGWRLELRPEELRVRRYFRWSAIPWQRISAVESKHVPWGRWQESVVVKLGSHESESLGTFNDAFSINLRDRLRYELKQRRARSK